MAIAILCSILAYGEVPAEKELACSGGGEPQVDDEMGGDAASFIQLRLEGSRKAETSLGKLTSDLIGRMEDDARKVVAKLERLGYPGDEIMKGLKDRIRKMSLSEIESDMWSAGDTKRPECVAVKACAAAYRFGSHGELMAGDAAAADLQDAGFTFVRGFNVTEGEDWDYSGWWEKNGDCMITFQGSDANSDYANNWDPTPVTFWGFDGVHRGMTSELQPLIDKMDFSAIKQKCPGKLTVVGHSLGGGLAQLFSAALNHPDDLLGAGLHVDELYTFGATPIADESLTNGADGCFPGRLHWTAKKTDGVVGVDIIANTKVGGANLDFDPVKADKVLLMGPGNDDVAYPCGNKMPTSEFVDIGVTMHLIQFYEFYTGCISGAEFGAFLQAMEAMHR